MNTVSEQLVPRPTFVSYLLLALGYILSVRLSLFFISVESVAIIWLPNALALTYMLYYLGQSYFAFALIVILSEIIGDIKLFPWYEAMLMGVANIFEITVAYYLMRKTYMSKALYQSGDISKFVVSGPLVGSLCGAIVGAAVIKYFGSDAERYLSVVQVWWFGDALGLLILTPLLLSFLYPREQTIQPLQRFDIAVIIVSAGLAVMTLMAQDGVLWGISVTPNIFVPSILYLAVRTNLKWTAIAMCLVTLSLAILVFYGKNPFGDLPISLTVISVQEYILILSVVSMAFTILLARIRENEANLEGRVTARTRDLELLNAKLKRLTVTDTLTGIANRRLLIEHISKAMVQAKRSYCYSALLFLDLDNFKPLNDTYGHEAGDLLLIEVAGRLKASVREIDTVARVGGDEFVVLLTQLKQDKSVSESEVMSMAEKIQSILAMPYILRVNHSDGRETIVEHRCTACVGVKVFLGNEISQAAVMKHADDAMYQAKKAGRNQIRLSDAK